MIESRHPRWTTALGNVASPHRAGVDPAGQVCAPGAAWWLDWCIGADDRWRMPADEPGVRQRLIEDAPVVETAMRVPGGDAIHRCYGVRHRSLGDIVMIEVENRSPVPVAVALRLRPGSRAVTTVDSRDSSVSVNGRDALVLPGRPRLVAAAVGGGDALDTVRGGDAVDGFAGAIRCRQGLAQAAFLYPLAHTASLRVALLLDPSAGSKTSWLPWRARERHAAPPYDSLATVPTAAAVARSWHSHTARGLQLALPPGRLADGVAACRRFLLLAHRGAAPLPGQVIMALDRFGFHREAAEALQASGRGRSPGLALAGAEHSMLTGDEAGRTRGFVGGTGDQNTVDVRERLSLLLEEASPTWSWPGNDDGHITAEFCSLVRDSLVREHAGGLELCASLPSEWLGQGIEVHDAPTAGGLLSFAVRWHGKRPAVLWDLRSWGGIVHLAAPGLDPAWSTNLARGENLLSAVEIPTEDSLS